MKGKISLFALLGIVFLVSGYFVLTSLVDDSNQINKCLHISSEKKVEITYDDRYDVTSNDTELEVVRISNDSIKSYIVDKGKKTDKLDSDVIKLEDNSKTIIDACGIGEATVYLAKKKEADLVSKLFDKDYINTLSRKEKKQNIGLVKLKISVRPARLTTMFIAGQSNAEGTSSNNFGFHPEDSVLCERGTVYSSYTNHNSDVARNITGIKDLELIPINESRKSVPSSLTSTKNIYGEEMKYKLDSLTQDGNGKTGFDSGLAYEWNRRTTDKVWVVNAAWGGSSVKKWIPGEDCYINADGLYKGVDDVIKAEISAGHYYDGDRFMFWLQGEADASMNASEYKTLFLQMYNSFKVELGIERIGIIMVRSSIGDCKTEKELNMTGPRIAQNYLGNSSDFSEVYVVSNVNEEWVSDEGVRKYFESKYSNGKLQYPLRATATINNIPNCVDDVHFDIHYSQIGHNENGITAADEMLAISTRERTESISGQFKNENGETVCSINMKTSSISLIVPVVKSLASSKNISFSLEGDTVTWDMSTGVVTSKEKSGKCILHMINDKTKKDIAKCIIDVTSNDA